MSEAEDQLLDALRRERGGWWLFEVPVGYADAPASSRKHRRFDAVALPSQEPRVSRQLQDLDEFKDAVVGSEVELIEAKKDLNLDAVGQLLAGASMFTARYPDHGPLRLTAVVERDADAALRWYCASVGIEVVRVDPDQMTEPRSS